MTLAAVGDVERALVGEGYLPDRGLATAVFLAVALEIGRASCRERV